MASVRIRSIPRSAFTSSLLSELHALAARLMAEDIEHFRVHAHSNDVVHVFENEAGIVGFQFWSAAPMAKPGCLTVRGGKLRVLPAFRGQALHLRSGLRFYLETRLRHPLARVYRLSLASLFGFVSISSALADYRFFSPGDTSDDGRLVRDAFVKLGAESNYVFEEATGLFFVNIYPSKETWDGYPASYYQRPEARAYLEANPGYPESGKYVAFWFRFSPQNLFSIARTIRKKTGSLRLI